MSSASPRIVLVEDDLNLGDVVRRYLERDGYEVAVATDGVDGLRMVLDGLPDLVILDLMLPRLDGLEVCRRIRQVAPIPVIILTARSSEDDRIRGLDLGADDYLAKPFSPRELVARVRAVLRRAAGGHGPSTPGTVQQVGDLEIDLLGRQARLGGTDIGLTSRELDLLAHLAMHPGQAFSRAELLEAVWGHTVGDTATVTVHVQRLRDKLGMAASVVATVRGIGYRFDRPTTAEVGSTRFGQDLDADR